MIGEAGFGRELPHGCTRARAKRRAEQGAGPANDKDELALKRDKSKGKDDDFRLQLPAA
jgi:hypothetical protein